MKRARSGWAGFGARRWLWVWLRVWLCLACCATAWAQTPVRLDPQASMITLAGKMDWLRHANAPISPEAAQAAPGWQALAGELNAGFTLDSIWLRFEAEQPVPGLADWRLELDSSLIEDVRFYQQTPDQQWVEQRAGLKVAHSAWPLDTRTPTFGLLLPQGRHTLMLRLESRMALVTGIRLWSASAFETHARHEALGWGVYLGMFALAGLFQFVFWLFAREAISGWYLPYALMIFLLGLIHSAYLPNALDVSGQVARQMTVVVTTLTIALFGQFTASQLALSGMYPRMSRFFRWLTVGLVVVTLVLAFAPPVAHVGGLTRVLWMTWLVVILGLVGVVARQGNALARLFLWAFGVLFVGVATRFLRNMGLLAPGLATDHGFPLAVMLHMVMVSLFIIYRYNALKQALQVAQAAHQQQRDFVAMVSHEFRTPLAIISTSVQQIAHNLDAPRDKTARRCDNVRAATRRMTALMDDYLSLDRLDGDTQPLQLQACDVEKEMRLAADERPPGRVQLTVSQLPPHFVCDPSLLRIAVHNLLANADRHSPVDQPIHLHACGNGPGGMDLTVTVTDHGEGIAADELAKLFLKYFRGRAAQRRPGAGLGLYLVNRIATLHGGQVTVANAADGGAVFTLTLRRA